MMMNPKRKLFPRMLRQFEPLPGSTYGRLDLFAKDEKTVEISIGPHFVVFTAREAKMMIKDLSEWIAVTSDDAVVMENARTGESVVVVETDDEEPGSRPAQGSPNPYPHRRP